MTMLLPALAILVGIAEGTCFGGDLVSCMEMCHEFQIHLGGSDDGKSAFRTCATKCAFDCNVPTLSRRRLQQDALVKGQSQCLATQVMVLQELVKDLETCECADYEQRLTVLEATGYEQRLAALEATDYEQRWTDLEAKNYEQRLAALENVTPAPKPAPVIAGPPPDAWAAQHGWTICGEAVHSNNNYPQALSSCASNSGKEMGAMLCADGRNDCGTFINVGQLTFSNGGENVDSNVSCWNDYSNVNVSNGLSWLHLCSNSIHQGFGPQNIMGIVMLGGDSRGMDAYDKQCAGDKCVMYWYYK